MTWVTRKTNTYDIENLPYNDNENLQKIDYSCIRIRTIGFTYPVDIGSWCYTKRKKIKPKTNDDTCSVVAVKLNSYRKKRTDFVRRYLDFLSVYCLGKSHRTISSAIIHFRTFIEWCDKNSPDSLDKKENISSAFLQFTDYLFHKIRTSEINVNTAAKSQVTPMKAIQWMYDDKYGKLFEGVRRIRRSNIATTATAPPSEVLARESLETYQNIFLQVTDFVTRFDRYPLKLSLPQRSFWIFPNIVMYPPHSKNKLLQAFDYEKGRLKTIEEIKKSINQTTTNKAKKMLTHAEKRMNKANNDRLHARRINLATLAQQSFVMLFSADTGMGLEQISNLQWPKGIHKISSETQGFKTIKKRANGREVEFLISSSFIPLFNKYLYLRDYLLTASTEQNTDLLFFALDQNGAIRKYSQKFSTNFNIRLNRSFKIKNLVTTRQWRAYKSDWLIKNTDIATTATVLQNSTDTVLRHYIAGSESEATSEITSYFEAFNTALIDQKENSKSIHIGQCRSLDSPLPQISTTPFSPDCIKPEGCLFCKNYAIHADVIDYRKLLSFKYVIQQTRHLAASDEHYKELFDPVFFRIDNALETIKSSNEISKATLEKTQKDVYENEQLDPFWERKLKLLIDLELLECQ